MEILRTGIQTAVFLSIALALINCSTKTNTGQPGSTNQALVGGIESEGRYDYGGGGTIKSDPDLVRRTIGHVQQIAGKADINENLFKLFVQEYAKSTDPVFDSALDKIFPNHQNTSDWEWERIASSPALDAISKKKINFVEVGDCPKPSRSHSGDASVSKHNLDGE